LGNNHCNSQRTKHIDTRQHFVREWVEDEILKIIFTPTLNNTADIFTKNPTEETFNTHSIKLVKFIPKQREMCNFISFPNEAMIHETQKSEWIKVIKRKKKERLIPNCFIEMQAPKQQTKKLSRTKKHNSEFHPRIVMKKGTTRDFSNRNLHIHQKSKAVKGYSNMKPLNRKDHCHLKHFGASKAFFHPPIQEPTVSIHHKKERKCVQSTFGKDGKMGDWFLREFCEWFHTDEAKAHREQLKRNGAIKWL
jgi:hypothetical protein